MKDKINTVRLTNDQAHEIMVALDHYRKLDGESVYPETRDAFRNHVHIPVLCQGANGEAFDIVPAPPPLEAHNFRARRGARLYAVPDNANNNYRVGHAEGGVGGWYYDAPCCDEAAEFFQMLARQLRERA